MPATDQNHSAVVYNGYIYTTGGYDGNVTSSVFYAPINSAGTVGAWTTSANKLPSAIQVHSTVTYNGYIYTLGGCASNSICGGGPTSTVFYAPINSNGTVGAWIKNPNSLLTVLDYASAVAYNGYIYTIGGCIGSICNAANTTATVFYAQINTSSTGSWQRNLNSLPSAIQKSSAVIYNGYVYTIGGYTGASATSTVFYAPINSDGTIGTWNTNPNSLPSAITTSPTVAYNGYIYAIGGTTDTYLTGATSSVFYAHINSDGTVGAWATSQNVASVIYQPAVAYNGYVYTAGGYDYVRSIVTSTVFYAALDNRPIYWGLAVPAGTATGSYQGTVTFTSNYSQ